MTDLQPVLDRLVAYWPWVMKVATFVGFARFAAKPIGLWLREQIVKAYERVITTADNNDDHWLELVVNWRAYRILAFLLDMFCSVKLPLAEDLFKPSTKDTP